MTIKDSAFMACCWIVGMVLIGYSVDVTQTTWLCIGIGFCFVGTMWPMIRGIEGDR